MIPQTLLHIQFPNCLICNAEGSKWKWFTVLPGAYSAGSIFLIVGEKHSFLGSTPLTTEAFPAVCTHCGNVQFFINPEDVQEGE